MNKIVNNSDSVLQKYNALCIPCIPIRHQNTDILQSMNRLNLGKIKNVHVSSLNRYGIQSAFIFYSEWNKDKRTQEILNTILEFKYIYVYIEFPHYFKCCFLDPHYDLKKRIYLKPKYIQYSNDKRKSNFENKSWRK